MNPQGTFSNVPRDTASFKALGYQLQEYGAQMKYTYTAVGADYPHASYIAVGCIQHRYLMPTLLSPSRFQSNILTIRKDPGYWAEVVVAGVSVREAIGDWFNQRDILSGNHKSLLMDDCLEVACNPTCPEEVTLLSVYEEKWVSNGCKCA